MNMLKQTTLAFLSFQSILACRTVSEVQTIAAELHTAFIQDRLLDDQVMLDFIGGSVRLGFHDAGTWDPKHPTLAGGPTGCMPMDDPANLGLDLLLTMIDPILKTYEHICPQADFWYLVGAVAIDAAIDNAHTLARGPGRLLDKKTAKKTKKTKSPKSENSAVASFQWGRMTEPECAYKFGRLPNHQKGMEMITEVFTDRMGFNDQEIVALMGAHSVGKCHQANSGFDQAWDTTMTALDSEYFENILERGDWARANVSETQNMWTNLKEPKLLLLNTDHALAWEFGTNDAETPLTPEANCQIDCPVENYIAYRENNGLGNGYRALKSSRGRVDLIYPTRRTPSGSVHYPETTCPKTSEEQERTRAVAKAYMKDQALFQRDFIAVWNKMAALGYGRSRGELSAPCDDTSDLTKCCSNGRCVSNTTTKSKKAKKAKKAKTAETAEKAKKAKKAKKIRRALRM